MATSTQIRQLAFQLVFQLDASQGSDAMDLANGMEHGLEARDVKRAVEVARAAFAARAESDRATGELAPGWPAHRQPAIDRAILRLAHFEIHKGEVAGAIVINDAVNLAKEFGTEKSAGFVNALLDKILKSKQGEAVTPVTDAAPTAGEA